MSPKTAKFLKIGGIVLLIAIVVYVIYYFLKPSAVGNKYASAAALAAGKSGSDGTWTDTGNPGFDTLFTLGITGDYSPGIYNADAYGQAWFKGMNIKLSPANVNKYSADVVKFANDADLRKPHWSVAKGSFLTA